MERVNFNKIIIVSLCDGYSKELGYKLSQNLGMMFCDSKDLIEYELVDIQALEELCSKDYLQKSEKSVIKHIASFENVVVSISYDYLVHNINILKSKSLIVFVKLSKRYVKENGSPIDYIAFEEHTKVLKDLSTTTIELKKYDLDFVTNKIVETLGGLL